MLFNQPDLIIQLKNLLRDADQMAARGLYKEDILHLVTQLEKPIIDRQEYLICYPVKNVKVETVVEAIRKTRLPHSEIMGTAFTELQNALPEGVITFDDFMNRATVEDLTKGDDN